MENALLAVKRRFVISTIVTAIFCAVVSVFGMYFVTNAKLNQQINASKIGELASSNSELSAYIASQQPNHAHFETIASIIQKEEKSQIATTIPWLLGGIFLISTTAGWLLARRLLEPVQESYLSQRRFMQDVAHELRNPLGAMRSMIQHARHKPITSQKDTQTVLASLDAQALQLSSIATDLLLLERKETAGTELINISDLLQDVLEQLHHKRLENGVDIQSQITKNITAHIDPQHFVAIAKNLIENAIKYSKGSKKPIVMTLKKNKAGWEFSIRDHGIGIPKEEVKYITQRFYRAQNAGKTDGTGLGMAIVSKFVFLYKGNLHIESTIGKGTLVRVTV